MHWLCIMAVIAVASSHHCSLYTSRKLYVVLMGPACVTLTMYRADYDKASLVAQVGVLL